MVASRVQTMKGAATSEPLARSCGYANWDRTDLFDFLHKWIRSQSVLLAATDRRPFQRIAQSHSTDYEILLVKDEIRAIQTLHKSLCIALAAEISNIIDAKEEKLRGLLDSKSSLLSLTPGGQLSDVVSYLDEESLYCLEEASDSVKSSQYARDRWLYFDSARKTKKPLFENSPSVPNSIVPREGNARSHAADTITATITAEKFVEKRRAFWKTAMSAKKMERLASEHYCYKTAPVEDILKVRCDGCKEFSFDTHKSFRNIRQSNAVFVRLSRQHEQRQPPHDDGEKNVPGTGNRLVWHGFVDITPMRGDAVKFYISCAPDQIMDWPELRAYQDWAGSFPREPWVRAPKKYEKRMKQLFHNLRVTVINENDDHSLLVATGGYQKLTRHGSYCIGDVFQSWEGWVELHSRGRHTHAEDLVVHKTVTAVNVTRNGLLEVVLVPLREDHGFFTSDWLPRLFNKGSP